MPDWMIRGAGIDYFGNVVSARLVPSRVNDPHAASDATLALGRTTQSTAKPVAQLGPDHRRRPWLT